MELLLLNNFITNFNNYLTNILKNNLKQLNNSVMSDYHINILKNIGYHPIKYTNNIVLVLTQNINYWIEIELDNKDIFFINICRNGEYITFYYYKNYVFTYNQYLKKICTICF